nr:MAG TPA: hypothetical protein [Caudoviricetes sp.]
MNPRRTPQQGRTAKRPRPTAPAARRGAYHETKRRYTP